MGLKLFSFASLAVMGVGYVAMQQATSSVAKYVPVDGRIGKVDEICHFERREGARSREMSCDLAAKAESEWAGATLKRQWRVEVYYVSPVDHATYSAHFISRADAPRVGQTYRLYAHTTQLGTIRDN